MIKEKINDFYSKPEEDRERSYFYISEVGKCPRAIYFAFKKFPKKAKDVRVMRVLEHGDYVHQKIMTSLFSMGLIRASEITVPPQELVHGRADAIISIDNQLFVLEIKSIGSNGFKYLENPKPEHVKQIQMYMHYFKIPQGILFYENKDTQEIKEFLISYNEAEAKVILEHFGFLKEQIDKGIVPSAIEDGWQCGYCEYADECKKIPSTA